MALLEKPEQNATNILSIISVVVTEKEQNSPSQDLPLCIDHTAVIKQALNGI